MATGQLDGRMARGLTVVGELGLDGSIRAVRGALSLARHTARTAGQTLVLPPANVAEAALVTAVRLSALPALGPLVHALRQHALPPAIIPATTAATGATDGVDFADVAGQAAAKRALEVAAAGGHNVLILNTSRPQRDYDPQMGGIGFARRPRWPSKKLAPRFSGRF